MNVEIGYTPLFERRFKKHAKKFLSLNLDFKIFLESIDNYSSVDLGGNIHKYRIAVKSKNKGKSGGFRIITLELIVSTDTKTITFLTLYNKTDQSSISKNEINDILKDLS